MPRISAGAAMNSTSTGSMIDTISDGVEVSVAMTTLPARKAPNSRPASTVPPGVAAPSSATVIASKPMPASMSPVSAGLVPRICEHPARPASAPEISMTTM